ncbi:uncharacterized protein LOC100867320 isoform X1 [Apis florea]|uniref:uncharacterized protein LOC100867320 isoform X1 n=1 Tax=Apis florea TaxID=7463 RepID=UPI0012FE88B6|nr:uncharacterized protein LOC100867320 isoform X1 [Apis florea]XP_031772583.1 uncharacterized protein LOC100867320 isoform X1 [Apis florea]
MADSGIKRNIPIKLGDFSVIDTEFSNIRERFDAEMRKMEDEMSRFRSELMNRESNNFFKSTTRLILYYHEQKFKDVSNYVIKKFSRETMTHNCSRICQVFVTMK